MNRFKPKKIDIKIKDKQTFPAEIAKTLFQDVLTQDLHCDLIVKCGEDRSEYVAHRIILAGASKFLSDALQTANPGKFAVLLLPDIEPRTFEQILTYIYNGEVTLDSRSDLGKFVEGCKLLEIPDPSLVVAAESDIEIEEEVKNVLPVQENVRNAKEIPAKPVAIDEKFRNLTIGDKKIYLEKARNTVRNVYENMEMQPPNGKTMDDVVKKTRLVFEAKTMLRAEHDCGYCQKRLNVPLIKTSCRFKNCTVKNHIYTHHFCIKKRKPGRPRKNRK